MQAVGSEIIRYWVEHKASIGNYSLVQNGVMLADAQCVKLFSNQALAEVATAAITQDPAALNEPNAEVVAGATGNFATGDITGRLRAAGG